MTEKIPTAVLGATGTVGQRFIQLLDGHPWFEVVAFTGSQRSVGMLYEDACHWILPEPMPGWAHRVKIVPTVPEAVSSRLAFSALPSKKALELEPRFAQAGMAVCSNASAFRNEMDVPLLLPEVNPDHVGLVAVQRRMRKWSGFIATNPNCASAGLTVSLKALHEAFGVLRVILVSMQSVSGAGYPGVPSLDIQDNVIPWIQAEEEKVEWEPRKMLGRYDGKKVIPAEIKFSAHTNRVPVSEGHLVCASFELSKRTEIEDVIGALTSYTAPLVSRDLPSAPNPVINVRLEADRPQPRLDRLAGKGMTTVVGRLRPDPIFDYKMVVLSHNTIRGAAGGSIYNAELLVKQGFLK